MTDKEYIQSQFFIDEFCIDFCTGNLDRYILRLFPISCLTKLTIKTQLLYQDYNENFYNAKNKTTEVISLELSVGEIIDRLETLGYSIIQSRENFEKAKIKALNTWFFDVDDNTNYLDYINPSFPNQCAFETQREGKEYFAQLDFETFTKACHVIIKQKRRRIIKLIDDKRQSIIPEDVSIPIERFLICNGLYSIMFDDKISYIRLLLNGLDLETKVQYLFDLYEHPPVPDIAEIYSYHFDPRELSLKYGLRSLIITEGVTDSKYLKFTLEKMFPHLIDLFYFLDFKIKDGNADAIVQASLTLASSGVPNNIIALFDNDFEGNRAKEKLLTRLSPLPSNVCVLSYPDLDIARNYPILKAGGSIEYKDVNGRGCPIEMYLGERCLKNDGELIPLTEGPNGQLSFRPKNKSIIQARFQSIMDEASQDINLIDLKKIIHSILRELKN